MTHSLLFTRSRWWMLATLGLTAMIFAACGGGGSDARSSDPRPDTAGSPTQPSDLPASIPGAQLDGDADADVDVDVDVDGVASARLSPLADATTWLYQLQGRDDEDLDLVALSAYGADLLVVDFSRNGSNDGAFTPTEIAAAQADGAVVIAYLSIGEAESYRDYWSDAWVRDGQLAADAPAWLGPFNPDFPDNHKVRYWLPEWQELVLGPSGLLRRIADAGFDGVYLDIIDAYEYWETLPAPAPPQQGPQMAEFIKRIAHTARIEFDRPDFLIVPQNGAGILATLADDQQRELLDVVDGIGVEDTFFFGTDDENNPLNPQDDAISDIERFRDAGKPVFAVDYLTDVQLQRDFYDRARAADFNPLVTVRDLDRVIAQPTP